MWELRDMKYILLIIINLCINIRVSAQLKSTEHIDAVNEFKKNLKKKNIDDVYFPLKRQFPIPEIKNKNDLLNRFDEVFDEFFIKEIINSNTTKDWSQVGWRGIMFENGYLWLSEVGSLVAVNYQSKAEDLKRKNLIIKDKKRLHASINIYDSPISIFETKTFRIRIDYSEKNGYRYSSWNIKKRMGEKPDLIINNGEMDIQGTMSSEIFIFKNNGFTYQIQDAEEASEGGAEKQFLIFNGEKEIFRQKARSVEMTF